MVFSSLDVWHDQFKWRKLNSYEDMMRIDEDPCVVLSFNISQLYVDSYD